MGQKFKFGLERVRELREHAEAQAKEDLAASLGQRLRGASMLAQVDHDLSTATANRPGAGAGVSASAADLRAHELWLRSLEQDREQAALRLDRLDAEVEARRVALGEASREREVLERLKERRRVEHTAEIARQEAITLDEIALGTHLREHGR